MPDYKYLIIGGGMTADAAVKGIRSVDATGTIGIISSEAHPPYNRPPLSKALWKGELLETIWRKTPMEHVTIHTATKATLLDVQSKTVFDEKGTSYSFHKLLLATGGAVRRLPFSVEGIIYFRTLDDYQHLQALTQRGETFAVIGGGFIGSEIAAALAMHSKKVTMIFPEVGIGARVYPPHLVQFLNSYYRSKGVEVLSDDGIASIDKRGTKYAVSTTSGKELLVNKRRGVTVTVDSANAGNGNLKKNLLPSLPEEREQFKEEWKHKCGWYPGIEEEKKEQGKQNNCKNKERTMKIGILGTGMVGQAIAGKLSELGHEIVIGTRDVHKTLAQTEKTPMGLPPFSEWRKRHPKVRLATFAEAAAFGELIFNCTNGAGSLQALQQAGAQNLKDKILVDVSNPLDFSKGMPPTLLVCNADSLGEQIQRAFPDLKVVKALNTMNAMVMVQPGMVGNGDHHLFMCGNEAGAKAKVKELLGSFGWKPENIIDLGDMTNARGMEMILPLWVRLYGTFQSPMFQFKIVR